MFVQSRYEALRYILGTYESIGYEILHTHFVPRTPYIWLYAVYLLYRPTILSFMPWHHMVQSSPYRCSLN